MPSAGGPCRFGQYHRLHKRVLENYGYGNVPIYSPNSEDSYDGFPGTAKHFRKLGYKGFVFGDYLFKLYMASRARADDSIKAREVFESSMKAGYDDIIAGGDNLRDILYESSKSFNVISNGRKPKVKIGVVGEIYIRNNRFANNDLVSKLENYGAEVFLASFTEWINYTTYMYKMISKLRREFSHIFKSYLQDFIQHREEHKIIAPVDNMLNGNAERPIAYIMKKAKPYMNRSIGGEAILSIGKAIDYVESGCGGVVNCMPFTCMPGNIVQAISAEVKRDLGDVPWLNIAYEGPGDPTEDLKIEAFVDQAEQWIKKRQSQ
jgi:predicted nucleotide-binding protein (sugar kinase/HSP70/actin superfamily)